MTGLYLSREAVRILAVAQSAIDVHTVALDGRCQVCGSLGCAARTVAQATFARYHQLPRRRPGATHPETLLPLRAGRPGR